MVSVRSGSDFGRRGRCAATRPGNRVERLGRKITRHYLGFLGVRGHWGLLVRLLLLGAKVSRVELYLMYDFSPLIVDEGEGGRDNVG